MGPERAKLTARRRARTACNMAKHDAAFGQIVWRELQRHGIPRDDADMVFAHLSTGISDKLMTVFQGDAKTRIRQHFGYLALHFNKIFFCH
jgi:hypothetical protein